MPRLSPQRVPKYGKHKQSGQARVVLNGRHYLLGPHGSKASRDEYDRRVAEWVANGRQAPAAIPQGQRLPRWRSLHGVGSHKRFARPERSCYYSRRHGSA